MFDKSRGSRFIEVKPYAELENEDFKEKFSCRQKSAMENGVPLLLVTDKQVRVNPVLCNLKLLHRYSGLKTLTPLHLMLLDIVRKSGKVRVRDLVHETGEPSSSVLTSVISWLAIGEMSSDLSVAKLGIDSVVW